MREIKFRFWYQKGSTGELRHYEFTLGGCLNGEPFDVFDGPHIGAWYMKEDRDEFTGLHDKNGKEIYEGDIIRNVVKTPWVEGEGNVTFGFVVFSAPHFMIARTGEDHRYPFGRFVYHSMEVIGNIHENPELLEG